jgi:polyvinyl alcohol dehydrogenase (cytochrome)
MFPQLPAFPPKSISPCAHFAIRFSASLIAIVAIALSLEVTASAQVDWPQFGQNNSNTAGNHQETAISPTTVVNLKKKWKFTTEGDVSARPAVVDNIAYFPDWGGYLWAVNGKTGKAIWGKKLGSYVTNPATGKPFTSLVWARATPAVRNGVIYIGLHNAAGYFLAIKASNGKLVWKTRVETVDTYAGVTAAASVNDNTVYVGVTGGGPGTARGSVVALETSSGKLLWKTYMVPGGYTGGTVWGSGPVVDSTRGTVFVSTGDNYTDPTDPAYASCISASGTPASCQSPENYADAIVALNMNNGTVKWAHRMETWPEFPSDSGSDFFNLSCRSGAAGCPTPQGPDFDFGSAPQEITYSTGSGSVTILGAGQKSGLYYAFNPDTGALLWQTQVGPGGHSGGIMWGSATDGQRIYVAIANVNKISYAAGTAGSWAALNPANGAILWQVPDPNGAMGTGPVAVANGVVYVTSTAGTSTSKNMLALNAATGKTLWSYASGATTIGGATIVNGVVYWGTGYARGSGYTGGNKSFYAFSINGK